MERGKYYNLDKLTPQKGLSQAPTLPGGASDKPTEEPVIRETPEQLQKSVRLKIVLSIGWVCMVGSAAGTVGYYYVTKQGPFAPEEKPVVTAPTASGNPDPYPEAPTEIRNNKDLELSLKITGIRATKDDFEFEAGLSGIHAKAVRLNPIVGNPNLGTKDSYTWEAITERITPSKKSELLIAVRVTNPYVKDNMNEGTIPDGYRYIARSLDPEDPAIMYFYYNRCTHPEPAGALAQIGMPNPVKPKELMWARSFKIPACAKNDDSVESDAQSDK